MYFYGSIAGADAYINTAGWLALSSSDKELNMYMAALWLDDKMWKGNPTDINQVGAWPRSNVKNRNCALVDSSVVPDDIINASYELANLNYLGKTIYASSVKDYSSSAGALTRSTVTAGKGGGVEVTKEFDDDGSSVSTDKVSYSYPLVDALISQYLLNGGSTNRMVRY